ncbi:MAG: MBL fold metallo-hydrolase [Ilumatobacteraceae bacterium]
MTTTLADTMFFRQYYLGCLSHASYLVGDVSSGVAAVIDPQRDVSEYLADAEAHGLTIRYVLETHFHADFLSGHLELAAATGATIGYGRAAEGRAEFPITTYAHGDRIVLGRVELEILETPGHTPESISIVVRPDGHESDPYGVLTGDTLFIGDVGRPDLLASVGVTADDLGRLLYHSLHDTLLTLPDSTMVYPAHGAGSACGKNLSTETMSTIGEQRRTNYALAPMSENEFVEAVTEGQTVAPMYFSYAATLNRKSRDLLAEDAHVTRLTLTEALAHQAAGAVVIDARTDSEFAQGHLRGSVNVGLGGRFAEYAGEVMTPGTPIVLVVPTGHESEATIRLARIGFDNVVGALDDPTRSFLEHPEHVEMASRLSAAELASRIGSVDGLVMVDVRNPGEVALGSIAGALHVSLPSLINRLGELDPTRPTVVFCAGGYRSSIARSFLRSRGFADVSDVIGGFTAWAAYQHMQSPAPAGTPAIDVETVAADPNAFIFDVREQEEWDAGHVDGAVLIPMGDVVSRLAELPRDRQLVCMCRSGNRSGRVTTYLRGQGLDVVNLTGGALQWKSAGHPLVDAAGSAGTVS